MEYKWTITIAAAILVGLIVGCAPLHIPLPIGGWSGGP